MLVRELRPRPHSWSQYKANCATLTLPFHALEWLLQWTAYYLSRWALLEVLEYLSVLSVLFAVIFYFAEAGDRQKQKHYQAWQVINTAQGKGGSGVRAEPISLTCNPSNAPRDRAAHRPYPCGKGERQVFCRRRHSTLPFAAQGTHLIATETCDVYAGRALSEEKCIPVVGKGFKPHCDRLRLLVDVFQAAQPP